MTYEIQELNLLKDWINIKREQLTAKGYDLTSFDDDKVAILYFSYLKRGLTRKPRNINKSTTFTCPTELAVGLALLEQKIVTGEDLTPYLSKGINKLSYQDKMLFDWGIHHLHLGENIDSSGFIARTGPVLYARFDDERAYLIQILNHGHWSYKELIEILHANWPETLSAFRLSGDVKLTKNYDDEEIAQLRGANINTLLQLNDGSVYLGPGWGLAGSGDSIDSVEKSLDTKRNFKKIEDDVKINMEKYLPNDNEPIGSPLRFKLIRHDNGSYYIHESVNDWYTLLNGPQ